MSSMTVSPAMSPIGNGALTLVLHGSGTAWANGTTTLSLAQGAGTISGLSILSATLATVLFTPAADTPSAVLLTMSSGESAAFAVYGTDPSFVPAPAAVPAGRTTPLTLTGRGTTWTAATTVTPTAGAVSNIVVDLVNQIITLDYAAPAAPGQAVLLTSDGLRAVIGAYTPALLACGAILRRYA